jgi:hypothetical protein
MITRKDLLGDVVEEKIKTLILHNKRVMKMRRNETEDTNPISISTPEPDQSHRKTVDLFATSELNESSRTNDDLQNVVSDSRLVK